MAPQLYTYEVLQDPSNIWLHFLNDFIDEGSSAILYSIVSMKPILMNSSISPYLLLEAIGINGSNS